MYLPIKMTAIERAIYEERLKRVEEIKTELADKYCLHPSNYVTKKDDNTRDIDLHIYHSWDN
jgi:hypothetical protein